MESQFLTVIRAWAALAWADGKVVAAEEAAIRRLIEASPELGPREREIALGFLARKVDLEAAGLAGMAAEAREGVYRAAVKLSAIDRDVADAERVLLGRLREGLGLDAPTAERIEASVGAGRSTPR